MSTSVFPVLPRHEDPSAAPAGAHPAAAEIVPPPTGPTGAGDAGDGSGPGPRCGLFGRIAAAVRAAHGAGVPL